uniref:Uncharacterized protein n=1 Tax=Gopherus agassizii TaxID=38772 RepID=A0A452ITE8_9SAUR
MESSEHFTGHVTSAKKTQCRYLDSSTSAFANSIWHSSTRRVNHRNQPNKAEVFYRKVDVICVKLEAFWELIIWQSQVAKHYLVYIMGPRNVHVGCTQY